jgi:transposase InsO family protein
MTDNAWNYTRSRDLAAHLQRLGARHILIKPHCPWQNGKVCECEDRVLVQRRPGLTLAKA